jgi:Glycosyl hydrolases family 16
MSLPSYQVLFKPHASSVFATSGTVLGSGTTTATVSGLSPGVSYDFEVQALNDVGSSVSNLVTATTAASAGETTEGFSTNANGVIINASQTNWVASSGPFSTFQLVAAAAPNAPAQIIKDGGAPLGGNVVLLAYHNHSVWQHATDGSTFDGWWIWNFTTSDQTAGTPGWCFFQLASVALSGTTYPAGATAGTTVGTITVTMATPNTANEVWPTHASGTLTLSGADATNFVISGTNLNVAAGHTLAGSGSPGTQYNITITAQFPSGSGTVSNSVATSVTLSQQGVVTAIPYGTNPTTNGFPAPLPLSASGVAGQATSPMGWPVDFFDDFTGTLTRINVGTWWGRQNPNAFTTGALYQGSLAQYGCLWGNFWGGEDNAQVDDTLNNVSMSGSNLICTATMVGGVPHTASFLMCWPTPWGYWETSVKSPPGANGSINSELLGFWFSGSGWPQSGEFDVQESFVNGIVTNVHMGTAPSSDNRAAQLYSSGTLPNNGHCHDGLYHTYGGLLTPAYIAVYVDGVLLNWSNSANWFSNLSTATDPPFSSAPGSFGYRANQLSGSPSHLQSDGGTSAPFAWVMIAGLETSYAKTYTAAQFPMVTSFDWLRHSKLTPATGGPHV